MTKGSGLGASSQLVAWGGTSRTADLGGPVHYVDFGGDPAGPRIVLVHGLGGSHLNWCLVAPKLTPHARVLAVDLVGFGLTHPEGRSATVQTAAGMLDRFVREVAGAPAVLVGNSMGGMASILEAAANPDAVARLVLIDPVLPLTPGARPDRLVRRTASSRYARHTRRRPTILAGVSRCFRTWATCRSSKRRRPSPAWSWNGLA